MNSVVAGDGIQTRIFLLRGQKVMLSTNLAELYDVEARAIVQAVKGNHDRFQVDCMFSLSETEFANLKSQIVTSSWGGLRHASPYAFSEHGAIMAADMLKSGRAIQWGNRVATRHHHKKVGQ